MENMYASLDSAGSLGMWGASSRLPEKSMNNEGAGYTFNNRRKLNDPVNGLFGGDDEETGIHGYEFVNHLNARRGFRETSPQLKDPDRLWKASSSRAGNDQWEERAEWLQAFLRNTREPEYQVPSFYGYGRPTKSHHDVTGHNSFENLEADRAELMWKLEQLNHRICRLKETGQRLPSSRNMAPGGRYNARFTHYDGAASSTSPYDMQVQSNPVLHSNFLDPFGPRIMGATSKYTHHPSNGPFPKEHMEYIDPEPLELYPRDPFPPHPPDSRKFLEDRFHHHVSPVRVRQVDCDPVVYGSRDQLQPHERRSVNSSSDNSNNLGQAHAKVGLASIKSRKHYVATAGGAPFIICSNCSSVLILPRWLRFKEKNREKARCGSCSTVICLQLEEKRLFTCITDGTQEEVDNRGLSVISTNGSNARGLSFRLSHYSGINSCDDTEQNFSWTKSKENAFSWGQGVDVGHNEKMAGSSSSLFSPEEDEGAVEEENRSHKGVIIKRDDHTSPALPGTPLVRNPQNSASMIAHESRWENEKSSDNSNKEKAFLRKSDLPRGYFKEDPDITEVEVSASEYPITSLSQDSTDMSKEDQPKNKKGGGRSFFKSLMKRSIREQLMHEPIIENDRPKVTVNGHPIPDDVVKQAEVLAGPILPGDYWYDYRAGFWGVMKHPCLGIIPPFIKEFNHPLPTNCSCGNTGIFINGRQLHEHDLKLLTSRGLPTTRNQFYIIDIFGKVIDKDTGQKLYDLGKLAPTVVKAGRGFGMRVPKGMI